MSHIKLTNAELLQLEVELSGFAGNSEVKFEGILAHKLPLKLKFGLNQLLETVVKHTTAFRKVSDEFIKTHGTTEDNGSTVLKTVLPDPEDPSKLVANPLAEEYAKQITELREVEHEINHATFTMEEFGQIETTEVYPVFYKLLKVA